MACVSKAALYIRVSTEEQASEGQSVAAQIETLSQYCRLYDIEIYKIYKDLGISGKDTKNRPGLAGMLQEAKQGKFDTVLVWKISRLSRSLKDLLLILDELEKYNIIFSSYSEKFDTSTAVGKMTMQLLGSIAEFERNTIIDNVKLGLQEYARKGGKTGTVLGYNNFDKGLEPNPKEAEIVRMIYSLYAINRMSMSDIAKHLNSEGHKTKRRNSFSKDSIAVILSNPVYIGINRHKIGSQEEYKVSGSHQPIVALDVWNAAQLLRKNSKANRPPRGKQPGFLLSGKVICPSCSSSMYGFTSKAAAKSYRYYRCKGCNSICGADIIEKAVLDKLEELLYSKRVVQDVLSRISENGLLNSHGAKVQQLQKERGRTKKLLDKYLSLLEAEEFKTSSIMIGKIKELEDRLKQLDGEIERHIEYSELPAVPQYTQEEYMHAVSHVIKSQDAAAVKRILNTCVKSATLFSDKTLKDINLAFKL